MTEETPEYGQDELVHELPHAEIVDRIEWLAAQCTGKRVIHVGFADAGFRLEQGRSGRWLHGHLHEVASELVGIDADEAGVAAATEDGFEAYVVDCTDAEAVAALNVEPADVVLAGEVTEHISAPGPFLDAMHHLCKPDGHSHRHHSKCLWPYQRSRINHSTGRDQPSGPCGDVHLAHIDRVDAQIRLGPHPNSDLRPRHTRARQPIPA